MLGRYKYPTVILLMMLAACEQNIIVELDEYSPKASVQCILFPGETATLVLSESVSYFDYTENPKEVNYIRNALVVISNGNAKDTLNYDSAEESYQGATIIKEGTTYEMLVSYNGKSFTAETTVPYPVEVDSITVKNGKLEYFIEDGDTISAYTSEVPTIRVHFTDPEGLGDYYLLQDLFSQYIVDSSLSEIKYYITPPVSDEFGDGDTLSLFQWLDCGYGDFLLDSIELEIRIFRMNEEMGLFFTSLNNQVFSEGDPFTEPSPVKSNIENALGIFGAQAVSQVEKVTVICE